MTLVRFSRLEVRDLGGYVRVQVGVLGFLGSGRFADVVDGTVVGRFVMSGGSGGGVLVRGGAGVVALLVVVGLLSGVGGPVVADSVGFSDIGGAGVHEGAVRALLADGVFEGTECGEGRFCPGDSVERWVMAVWLVRVLDEEDPGGLGSSRFVDVDASLWWAPYVERLADFGVTAGCATNPARFCPRDSVSRAQMATFLVRAFGLASGPDAGFVDVGGGVHAAGINALAASGVTAGCATGPARFCPGGDVTRAQMSSFLNRARGYVPPEPRVGFARRGGREVWVMNADGSNPKRLTDDVGWNPVWSPDSSRIAYHGGRDGGIGVVGADGRDRRQVTSDGGYHPIWHPDGTRFVYVADDRDVWVVNTDSTGRKQLLEWGVWSRETGSSLGGVGPVWSPDGSRIAFATAGAVSSTPGAVWVMNGDGTGQRQVSDHGYSPRWSPDGDRLVYGVDYIKGRYQDRVYEVWVVDADGTGGTKLADSGRSAVWSPDGSRVAYVGDGGIYVMDADGANSRQLTFDKRDQGPVWSPDGSRIVYSRGLLNPGIFVREVDGSDWQMLTEHGHDPAWSPDGSQIAYVGSETVEFLVMDADGGNQQPLASLTDSATDDLELKPLAEIVERAVWSPDGSKIVYNDGRSLYVIEADGTNRTRVAVGGCGWVPTALWSPDSRFLMYQAPSTVVIIDADDGTRTVIHDASGVVWSPDGSRLVYTNSGGYGIFVSGSGGENPQQILDGRVGSLAWSLDGKRIAYTSVGSMSVVDADGQNQREVVTFSAASGARNLQWLPDGSSLSYNTLSQVYVVDTSTAIQQKITQNSSHFLSGAAWSPDRSRLVYALNLVWYRHDYGGHRAETIEWEPGHGIRIVDSDGDNNKQLTTGRDYQPVWIQAEGTHRG